MIQFLRQFICLLLILMTSFSSQGSDDVYPFQNLRQQQQFSHLTAELRCLVCQNQTLADSDAPLAHDLKQQVYQQVLQGQSDLVIKQYMVERYGNFVLYQPPLNEKTLLLWVGPFLILLFFLLVMFFRGRRGANG